MNNVEPIDLAFYFSVVVISLIAMSLRITAKNAFVEITLKVMAKIVPFFCMLYAGVEIFKHFGLI